MNKGITNNQLAFILFLTLSVVSLSSLPGTIARTAGVGGWVTLITASIIFGVFAAIIVSLNNLHYGQTIYEYSPKLVGNIGKYIITFLYIIYFLAIATFLSGTLSGMLKSNFLFETPIWITLFLGITVCCYGAYKGLTNVARLIEIYGIIVLIAIVFVHIIMLFQGNIEFIRPFYIPSETKKYFASLKEIIVPFLGIEVLTIIPLSKQNGKRAVKVAFFSIIAIGLVYVLVVQSSIMMVGMNEIIYYEQSMLAAIRLVMLPNIEFLRRIDVIFLIAGLGGTQVGIMMAFTALVEFISKIFNKVKRAILCLIVGGITLTLSLLMINIDNYNTIFRNIFSIYGLTVAAFIPIMLFIITKVKRNVQKDY